MQGDTTTPTVSVCVPMYNNSATIERCLDSVLAQQGVDFEIVVIDDDSTDGCDAIVSPMLRPGDRLLRNEQRLGLVGNHNKCLELARGKYVQFVHADDWMLSGAFETLTRRLDAAEAGFAFAPRKVHTDDIDFKRRYGLLHTPFRRLGAQNDGRALVLQMALRGLHHNWIGEPTCVMFRRELLVDAGSFRDDIYQLLDLDLWLRLMVRSTVCFHPAELSVRRHNAATQSAHNKILGRDWMDQLRVLATLSMDPAAPLLLRAVTAAWWLPIWLRVVVEGLVFRRRQFSAKTALSAPIMEFRRAKRVFPGATEVSA